MYAYNRNRNAVFHHEFTLSENYIAIEPIRPARLIGNYPNPFNPETIIRFIVDSEHTSVNVSIYNIRGQKVRTLVDDVYRSGDFSMTWNGTDEFDREVGSGIYFYRLQTEDHIETRKMILLK
jgi:hypothetical protein